MTRPATLSLGAATVVLLALVLWAGGEGGAFLSLGFVIGMAHAIEADHLAAVAALTERKDGARRLVARGVAWGLGHTLALVVICTTVILLGLTISARVEAGLELVVGLMIAGLGLRVLWRLHRERIHIHVHEHDGNRHIHAHSHKGETVAHRDAPHGHVHRALRENLATLGVGLVHGAAGSAGLLVLTVAATDNLGRALIYCAVFGLGSLVGMATLSAVASLPLGLLQRGTGWLRPVVMCGIGLLAISVGSALALTSLGGFGAGAL